MKTDRLNHRSFGDPSSPAVVFFHGFMGDSSDWKEVAEGLLDRLHIITVDLPGHGSSLSLPKEYYSIVGEATQVAALMDDLSIEQFALVGYSMGGRLALQLAVTFPSRVIRLVLESTTAGLKDEEARRERIASDELKAGELEQLPLEQFVESWYRQPLFASLAERPDLLSELTARRRQNEPNELAKSLRQSGTGTMTPLWDALKSIEIPSLCLAGELDPKYAALARQMAVAMSNCRAEIVPDAGHIVHLEQPETYIARLRAFLIT